MIDLKQAKQAMLALAGVATACGAYARSPDTAPSGEANKHTGEIEEGVVPGNEHIEEIVVRGQPLEYVDIINAYNNDNFRSIEYEPVAAGSAEFRLIRERALEFFPSIGIKLNF